MNIYKKLNETKDPIKNNSKNIPLWKILKYKSIN